MFRAFEKQERSSAAVGSQHPHEHSRRSLQNQANDHFEAAIICARIAEPRGLSQGDTSGEGEEDLVR
jgi:hypothetical protein